jgi:hypothetical protein
VLTLNRNTLLTFTGISNAAHNAGIHYTTIPPGTSFGIRIQNCRLTNISNNDVTHTGAIPTVSNTFYGISVETNCLTSMVSQNLVEKMGTGLNFANTNNYPTTVTCNNMQQNKTGVMLNNTILGNQGTAAGTFYQGTFYPNGIASDNIWNIPSSPGSLGITGINNPVTNKTWYVRSKTGAWFPPLPFIFPPLTVISGGPLLSATQTCGNICYNQPCFKQHLAQVAKVQSPFNTLPLIQQQLNAQAVYQTVRSDSSLTNTNDTLSIVLSNFRDSLANTNLGSFYRIASLLASGDTVNANILNSEISPSNVAETNQKVVNTIYIRTWAHGVYVNSHIDSITLLNIAKQNVIKGGTAVYDARLMIGQFFDDLSTMRTLEVSSSNLPNNPNVFDNYGKMYPNPTNANFYYEITLNEGETGTIELFNILGNKLLYKPLREGQNTIEFQAGGLANGVYLYKLFLNNSFKGLGKLILSK